VVTMNGSCTGAADCEPDGRGRGEATRMMFADAGIEFEDVRANDLTELRASGYLPFGMVPVLEIDGFVLAESSAIERYVAKKLGYSGSTDKISAIADMVRGGSNDLLEKWYADWSVEEKKNKLESDLLTKWLPHFERILEQHGGEYFAGELTYADFEFAEFYDNVVKRMYPDTFPKHPTLVAHHKRILTRPKIVAYIEKRKPTEW